MAPATLTAGLVILVFIAELPPVSAPVRPGWLGSRPPGTGQRSGRLQGVSTLTPDTGRR